MKVKGWLCHQAGAIEEQSTFVGQGRSGGGLYLYAPWKGGEMKQLKSVMKAQTVAQARRVYDEAVAQAEKAYQEAMAPAWKVYKETEAQAQKVYDEAVARARKVYEEAEECCRA